MHSLQLSDFAIDTQRGFLPAVDPLTSLPEYFSAWDVLGANLAALLLAGQARRYIERLPELDVEKLTKKSSRLCS